MSFRSVCKRVIHVLKWIPLSIPWAFGLAQIFFVIYCQLRFVIFSSERVTVLKVIESALFLFVALSALICDFRTCFSDPGYANTGDKHHLTSEEFEYYSSRGYKVCKYDASNSKLGSYDYVCRKCQALKPLRAHHCKICQKCILKMDHHCPWVNNCIGARNQKYFLLFLFYVFLGETYASLTGTYRLYKMITASNISYFEHEKIPRSVLTFDFHNRTFSYVDTVMITTIMTEYSYIFFSLLFEVVFSYVFMVFAVSISIDQIIGIRNNRTLIEALKKEDRPTSDVTFKDSLISTMGDPFNWKWFFPIEGSMMPKYIQELNNEIVCVNPVYDVEAHEVFNNENESKEEIIEDYNFFEEDGTKKDI